MENPAPSKAVLQTCPEGGRASKAYKPTCLLCKNECELTDNLTQLVWDNLKKNVQKWAGLDKFGDVYEQVPWANGPAGFYVHHKCKLYVSAQKTLSQALNRKRKAEQVEDQSTPQSSEEPSAPKRRKRQDGPISLHHVCVFCMKPQDTRHKKRKYSDLHLIEEVRFNLSNHALKVRVNLMS